MTDFDSNLIEFTPVLKIEKLKELLINDDMVKFTNYLSLIYDFMNIYYQQKKYDLLLNLLNYFETIILSRDISNHIINTQFIDLFMSFLNIRNENIQLRVSSILGFLIRYATATESSFEKYNFTEILISFISDNNVELNRKAIATLGEYLFFVSTQIEEELEIIQDNNQSQWNISQESILTLLFALNHSDEKVRFYSLKTIENISIKCTIAKKFFASNDDFILKIINIYNENCENPEIKTIALSTCSHLIRLEPNLFKIFINKNDKDNNKYDYSHINFITENKNNLNYFYNKENPSFEYYLNIFSELEKNISSVLNKFSLKNSLNISSKDSNIEKSNKSDNTFKSTSSNILENLRENAKSDDFNTRHEKEGQFSQKGNLEQLFMHYFEDGVLKYTNHNKDKAIEKLKIAKYILEYIIFQRIIIGNKDKTINFEKVIIKNEDKEKSNEDDNAIFATFIGGKIRQLKENGILRYNSGSSNENLNDYNDPKIENIKIYDNMINFYPRIIQFIAEIKKEDN
jgi:hypothetical protein